jgi:hypothetical protein
MSERAGRRGTTAGFSYHVAGRGAISDEVIAHSDAYNACPHPPL